MHGTEHGGIKAIDLAQRPPLRLGQLAVSPASRELHGPSGTVTLRPQPMLVFLVLADAAGAVVSRDELVEKAWSGRFVADDSLNGAISEVRRALRNVGVDAAEIVTVPKIGYRLVHPDLGTDLVLDDDTKPRSPSRRWLLGAGAALALGSAALWRWPQRGDAHRRDMLIESGLIALRQGLPDHDAQGVAAFRQAVALDPGHARAWGLLALSLRSAAEYGPPDAVARIRAQAEEAARRALALDPRQADARTALVLLAPMFGRWRETEQQLRAILADHPDSAFAVSGLATLLMSTGQVLRCLERLDWLDARDPLSPNLQFRRVYTLWSAGKLVEADAAADRALQSWPRHGAVWFARLWTFAFTGRAERSLMMLSDTAARPVMPEPAAQLLSVSLRALAEPDLRLKTQAIAANLAAAGRGPAQATSAIMVLSGLGAGTEALAVARGLLTQRGPVVVRQHHTAQQASVTDQHHRITMMLWIPATEALRRHPQFPEFCEEMGMTRYWAAAGVRPDLPIGV